MALNLKTIFAAGTLCLTGFMSYSARGEIALKKLHGHDIIETSDTTVTTFDYNDNHIRTYDLQGRLLKDVGMNENIWLYAAPMRVLQNYWLSGSILFDNDFNVVQSLFQTQDGRDKTCADGSFLSYANDLYTYDLTVRNNKYVLTSKQGFTFFDRQWNCLKSVKITAWKPGGNGGFRRSGRAPKQLIGSQDYLYIVDDYVHYVYDAEGQLLFVGQLGENGLQAADTTRPLRYGIELSFPKRMLDGSIFMTRSEENFLVAQSLDRSGQPRQPIVIRGPFLNTSYYLKVSEEFDHSLTLTYSEWVLRFDANGQYLGSRKFDSPVDTASINDQGQVLVKLMTEGSGAGNTSEPMVFLDNRLNPISSFSINGLFSHSNLLSWGGNYLVGTYSDDWGSSETHFLSVINPFSQNASPLGVQVPSVCRGQNCSAQSLSMSHLKLPSGSVLHVFKSFPNVNELMNEAELYISGN